MLNVLGFMRGIFKAGQDQSVGECRPVVCSMANNLFLSAGPSLCALAYGAQSHKRLIWAWKGRFGAGHTAQTAYTAQMVLAARTARAASAK